MADIFEIVGKISLDGVDKAEKELNGLAETGEQSSSKLSKFGKVMGGIGKGILAVTGAVATGSVALVKGVQASYGELQQNLGGSEAVFGQYASNIQKIGEEAYKNMGISQAEFLATANKMGSLLQGSGIDQQTSLDMTAKAMQRASDVASVMGIDMQTAMESITGACKGNFTMMDNLGVAMNATTLEAYALSKGMEDFSWKSASSSEKNALAMQMFLERTEQYAGNFARESTDTISGSIGYLGASWKDFMAGLGNPTADMSRLTNNLAQSFGAMINNIVPIVENIANSLPTVMDALIKAVSDLAPSLIETFTGLITKVVDGLVQMLPTVIPLFVDMVLKVAEALIQNLPLILDALILLVTQLLNSLVTMLPTLIPLIIDVAIKLLNSLVENLPLLLEVILQVCLALTQAILDNSPMFISAVFDILTKIVSFIFTDGIPMILNTIGQLFSQLFTSIGSWLGNIFTKIGTWFTNLGTKAKEGTLTFINNVINFFKELPNKIAYWLGVVIGNVVTFVTDFVEKAKQGGKDFKDKLINFIKELPTNIKNWFINTINKVVEFATNFVNKAKQAGQDFKDKLINAVKELPGKIKTEAMNIVTGLWNGILEKAQWLKNKVTNFCSGIIESFKKGFDSHSPARKLVPIGQWVTQGLGVGIEEDDSAEKSIKSKVDNVLGIANNSMANIKIGTTVDDLVAESPMQKYQLDFNAQLGMLGDNFDRLILLIGQYLPEIAINSAKKLEVNGDKLVLGISRKMDTQLGRIAVAKGRGNV